MKRCEDCGGTSFELTRSGCERCTECGLMICVDCGEGFFPGADTPGCYRPGRTNQCPDCGRKSDTPKVKGITVVEGKDVSYVEVVSAETADEFRRLSRVGSVRTH